MRKIYLTLLMVAAFGWANAQSVSPNFYGNGDWELTSVDQAPAIQYRKAKLAQSTKGTARWFYQPEAFNIFNASGSWEDYYAFTVFPDTTMLWSTDTTDHIFMHSMAVSIHPASPLFTTNDPAVDYNEYTNFSFDSVAVGYLYVRNTAASVVDTLVMQVQVNTWGYQLSANDYAWVQSIYGVQDMRVEAILHAPLTWDASGNSNANVVATIKFPLTANDTASIPKYLERAVGQVLNFTGGQAPKVSFTFIPGYSWTPNVDSIPMYNRFSFLTFGNASTGGYPYYETGDRNTDQFMRTFAYRDNTDDTFEPAYFFGLSAGGSPFPYQYHDVYFQFTALNTSVESNTNLLTVGQNQPNPFTGMTTVNYSLENNAVVTIDVYNVAGAKVMSINEGPQSAGAHKVQINAADLQAGVYYYTFTADGYTVTKKMIVY